MLHPRSIEIIKQCEGCYLTAYVCPAGKWTIGIGSLIMPDGSPVQEGDEITEDEANDLLLDDLAQRELKVRRLVKGGSEAHIGALASFAYNLGMAALAGSTLVKKHNRGDYEGAAKEFGRWVNGGGRKLPGLVIRRRLERELYESEAP